MIGALKELIGPKPLRDPRRMPSLAAWFDALDVSSMVIDGSNRVSLWADKSGNSAVNCLCLNGASGNYASTPDSAAVSVTGDIDLRAYVAMDTWVPAVQTYIIGKYTSGFTSNSYGLAINTAGTIRLYISTVGTDSIQIASGVATGFSNYSAHWIRATRTSSSGVVRFYTSEDGSAWSQLGMDSVLSAGSAIYDGIAPVCLGAFYSTGTTLFGRIYRAQIYNGINGTLVFDADFSLAAKLASSFVCSTGQTVTINTTGDLGARISGVRDLVQMTVAKQPVYLPWSGENYGWLNNVGTNFWYSPDSAAISVPGDIDMVARIAPDDWTPATTQRILGKWVATGDQRSYSFSIDTSGTLIGQVSTNGTAGGILSVFSSVSTGFADGSAHWVRVSRVAATGAWTFYTAPDGPVPVWQQLGSVVTGTSGAIYDSTSQLEVGALANGGAFAGRIYRVQVYNGIAGTLVADFDASRYTSGTTFTASTGETWTINGGAHIVTRTGLYFDGSNDYLKSAAFALVQPESVYFVGEAVSWTSNDKILDGNSSTERMAVYQYTGGTSPQMGLYAGSAPGPYTTWPIRTAACVFSLFSGAVGLFKVNRLVGQTANAGTHNGNGLTVGAAVDGSAAGNVFISEVAIYSTIHGDMENNKFVGYAAKRHRLTLT